MDRRRFMERISVSLAAASSVTMQSCSSTTGRYRPSSRSVNVRRLLKRIDRINERIASDEFFDAPSCYLAEHGCSERLFRETIQALLLVGVFGDLSQEDQMHPLMQDRIRESAGLFDRTALGMATFLENLSREQRTAVRKQLMENPDIIKSFQTAFDKEGRKNQVPDRRLQHFHTLWNRAFSSLKRRNSTTIIDEYIEKVDKVALQNGITPELRRKLAKNWDEELVVALFEQSKEYGGSDALLGSVSLQHGGDSQKVSKRDSRIRTGQKLLGISGVLLGMGMIFFFIAFSTDNLAVMIPGLGLGTAAVIVFLIGLIMVASGVSMPEVYFDDQQSSDYMGRVRDAVKWVNNERKTSREPLEKIVLHAVEKFDVEFNDVWESVEE